METQKRNKTLDLYNPPIHGFKIYKRAALQLFTAGCVWWGAIQLGAEHCEAAVTCFTPFFLCATQRKRCIASCRAHSVEVLFSCCVCLWGNKETSEQLEQVVRVLKFICQGSPELASEACFVQCKQLEKSVQPLQLKTNGSGHPNTHHAKNSGFWQQ